MVERLLHTHLAGFSHWNGIFLFSKLQIGTELRIQAEPENRYDSDAVAVFFEDKKIGYIPRRENSEIAKFCRQGYADIFDVRINRISPAENPENLIGIAVYIRDREHPEREPVIQEETLEKPRDTYDEPITCFPH